jgi:hypothetical protein
MTLPDAPDAIMACHRRKQVLRGKSAVAIVKKMKGAENVTGGEHHRRAVIDEETWASLISNPMLARKRLEYAACKTALPNPLPISTK